MGKSIPSAVRYTCCYVDWQARGYDIYTFGCDFKCQRILCGLIDPKASRHLVPCAVTMQLYTATQLLYKLPSLSNFPDHDILLSNPLLLCSLFLPLFFNQLLRRYKHEIKFAPLPSLYPPPPSLFHPVFLHHTIQLNYLVLLGW
jgi:hypothetical protein